MRGARCFQNPISAVFGVSLELAARPGGRCRLDQDGSHCLDPLVSIRISSWVGAIASVSLYSFLGYAAHVFNEVFVDFGIPPSRTPALLAYGPLILPGVGLVAALLVILTDRGGTPHTARLVVGLAVVFLFLVLSAGLFSPVFSIGSS